MKVPQAKPLTSLLIFIMLCAPLPACRHASQNHNDPDHALRDRYEIRLIHSDDFDQSLDSWIPEIETQADIAIIDGKLDINTTTGCTLWFHKELQQPLAITYQVTTLDDGRDSLPRDHNLFWMAQNPNAPDTRPSGTGTFQDYDCYELYYAGIGGNQNKTTRFRRYQNCERNLVKEFTDAPHLNTPDQTYHMKIICLDNKTQVYRDGQLYWEFIDPTPLTKGYFAFRQTRTHLRIDNFKVYSLTPKAPNNP